MIFIPGEVRSKKNSRRFIKQQNRSIASKACMKYYKDSQQYWEQNKVQFLNLIQNKQVPYKIEFTFIRSTKRRFDYLNLAQTVADEMVKYGYLVDDDFNNLIPYFAPVQFDKNNPGVIIKVL